MSGPDARLNNQCNELVAKLHLVPTIKSTVPRKRRYRRTSKSMSLYTGLLIMILSNYHALIVIRNHTWIMW